MKKMMLALVVALAVIFTAGVGESLAAKKIKPPKPIKDAYFKLVSSRQLPNKMWEYVIRPKMTLAKDSKPFVIGDHTEWSPEDLPRIGKKRAGDFKVVTYNCQMKINYGLWYDENLSPDKWKWAKTYLSKLFNEEEEIPILGFFDGHIYEEGKAPFTKPPGEFGR